MQVSRARAPDRVSGRWELVSDRGTATVQLGKDRPAKEWRQKGQGEDLKRSGEQEC